MKIDRLIGITMYLLNREKVTAKELAEKFEVSVRTISRDIDTLERFKASGPAQKEPGCFLISVSAGREEIQMNPWRFLNRQLPAAKQCGFLTQEQTQKPGFGKRSLWPCPINGMPGIYSHTANSEKIIAYSSLAGWNISQRWRLSLNTFMQTSAAFWRNTGLTISGLRIP